MSGKVLFYIVDANGRIVRGPVSAVRGRQLFAILHPAFPSYRLIEERDLRAAKP